MKKMKPVSLKEIYSSLSESEKENFHAAVKQNPLQLPELPKDNSLQIWLSRKYWERHEKIYGSGSYYNLTYNLTEDDANMSTITKTNSNPSSLGEANSEHLKTEQDNLLFTNETISYSKG